MAETPQEIVDRELREFKRYTGDDLPNPPLNAPLPVGDPQSGVHNPKKVNLRRAMLATLEGAGAEVDRAREEADRSAAEADRSQSEADRAQAEADRSTTEADRAQANADDAAAFAGYRDFADVATLLANTSLEYGTGAGQVQAGDILRTRKEGFSYEVIASDATDAHVETAGGVKLNYIAKLWFPAAWGIESGPSDQTDILNRFVAAAAEVRATVMFGPLDVFIYAHGGSAPDRGLRVPSHSHWVLHPDTRFRAIPNNDTGYEIIQIWNATDIVIEGNGARCVGERGAHTGTTGEWGMGVSIRGSSRIKISDLGADDCWGDGYYIGSTSEQPFVEDVTILRPFGDNNRRQGLSLISAKRFLCEDSYFSNVNGTPPAWGIDVEPNSPNEFLEDVRFIRPRSKNCVAGFGAFLNAFNGSPNRVDVLVEDAFDEGSEMGMQFSTGSASASGLIRVVRPYVRNNETNGIQFRGYLATGPLVELVDPKVRNANRSQSASQTYGSGVLIYAESSDVVPGPIGNIHIYGLDVGDDDTSYMTNSIMINDLSNPTRGFQNLRLIDPVSLGGVKAFFARGQFMVRDSLRTSVRELNSASETIGRANAAVHYVAGTHTGAVTKDLPDDYPMGADIVIENEAAFFINVRFPVGHVLHPAGTFTNRAVGTNQVGARIKLRRISPTGWRIIEQVGTWTTS